MFSCPKVSTSQRKSSYREFVTLTVVNLWSVSFRAHRSNTVFIDKYSVAHLNDHLERKYSTEDVVGHRQKLSFLHIDNKHVVKYWRISRRWPGHCVHMHFCHFVANCNQMWRENITSEVKPACQFLIFSVQWWHRVATSFAYPIHIFIDINLL